MPCPGAVSVEIRAQKNVGQYLYLFFEVFDNLNDQIIE
jgi:hypothetical protein